MRTPYKHTTTPNVWIRAYVSLCFRDILCLFGPLSSIYAFDGWWAKQLKDVVEIVRKFSRGYDEDEALPKTFLKLSEIHEPQDSSIESVIKSIFGEYGVSVMSLYEATDGAVSEGEGVP